MKRLLLRTLPALAVAFAAAAPLPAHAWGRVGVFVGGPVVFGFPLYYPPPVYAPPPVYYPPPPYEPGPPPLPARPGPVGFSCYARPYVCPLNHPRRVGRPCACEAIGGGAVPGTVQ